MKNVQIILDMNAENMEALMKENHLNNFDELRGYLLAILYASGVTEESAGYDKVDVVKKEVRSGRLPWPLGADIYTYSMGRCNGKSYTMMLEEENTKMKAANESLWKRNEDLIREIKILESLKLPTDQELQYKSEIELLKMERNFLQKREGELMKRVDVLQARIDGAMDALEVR